jgi:hypothetical protein
MDLRGRPSFGFAEYRPFGSVKMEIDPAIAKLILNTNSGSLAGLAQEDLQERKGHPVLTKSSELHRLTLNPGSIT